MGLIASLIAQTHLPNRSNHVFGADLLALGVSFGREFLVENHLGDAAAIAHVKKDEVAVVAATVNPAHQNHAFASMSGTKFPAQMRPFKIP